MTKLLTVVINSPVSNIFYIIWFLFNQFGSLSEPHLAIWLTKLTKFGQKFGQKCENS